MGFWSNPPKAEGDTRIIGGVAHRYMGDNYTILLVEGRSYRIDSIDTILNFVNSREIQWRDTTDPDDMIKFRMIFDLTPDQAFEFKMNFL